MRQENRIVVGIIVVTVAILFGGLVHGALGSMGFRHATDTTAAHSPRVCFPAAKWGPAPGRLAPCVRITAVYEDGSFTYRVMNRSGWARYDGGVGAQDR